MLLGKDICKRFLVGELRRSGHMETWVKRHQEKRTYTFGSNFKYLILSLTNEKFPIHPKTVKVKRPLKIYYLWIPTTNIRGRKRLQILWTSYMDGPNTLKGLNELLDYLQTNNAFRKSEFINYNFDEFTLLAPLSTMQQDVLDYLNEFIALQSVRDEYCKEFSTPILLP